MAEQDCQRRLAEMAAEIRELKREGRFVVRKISELADAMRETMPDCATDIDLVLSGLAKLVADGTAQGAVKGREA